MELHNLRPATGSTKVKKRLGRGEGSKLVALLVVVIRELNLVLDIKLRKVLKRSNAFTT
jgi:hypothetical protein